MHGREVALDEARFDRIVVVRSAANSAPVLVGHSEVGALAFAWMEGPRRPSNRLQAKRRDIAPPFRRAVESSATPAARSPCKATRCDSRDISAAARRQCRAPQPRISRPGPKWQPAPDRYPDYCLYAVVICVGRLAAFHAARPPRYQ